MRSSARRPEAVLPSRCSPVDGGVGFCYRLVVTRERLKSFVRQTLAQQGELENADQAVAAPDVGVEKAKRPARIDRLDLQRYLTQAAEKAQVLEGIADRRRPIDAANTRGRRHRGGRRKRRLDDMRQAAILAEDPATSASWFSSTSAL